MGKSYNFYDTICKYFHFAILRWDSFVSHRRRARAYGDFWQFEKVLKQKGYTMGRKIFWPCGGERHDKRTDANVTSGIVYGHRGNKRM